ncbi:hypothetical protein B7P43_G11510, partial [Cryptotermes secundus]
GAAVHTSAVQLTDNIDKALEVKEAPQVETKYILMRPEEVSHQKQLDGYITVDQPNLHPPSLEGNFREESGHAVKPHVTEDYNAHMGFVDKSDRMVNSYGIARRTWKWTKKLLFHLLDMTILNAYLLHKSCGRKMTHKKFREILLRDLILQSHEANITVSGVSRGRPSSSEQWLHLYSVYTVCFLAIYL